MNQKDRSKDPLLEKVKNTWTIETKNDVNLENSYQTWGTTYPQQQKDSHITRVNSRAKLIFVDHTILINRTSVFL